MYLCIVLRWFTLLFSIQADSVFTDPKLPLTSLCMLTLRIGGLYIGVKVL